MSYPLSVNLKMKDIYTETSTAKYSLGTRGVTADGRVFRYAKCGATGISVGLACINPAQPTVGPLGVMPNTSGSIQIPAGYGIGTSNNVFKLGGSWGGTSYGLTADAYKDGWLVVGSTGQSFTGGQLLRIKSHTGMDGGTSNAYSTMATFTLADGAYPAAAIGTSQAVGLMYNPYNGVLQVVSAAVTTGAFLGVTPINVTANYYFWLLTWGEAVVKLAGACSSVAIGCVMCHESVAATTGLSPISSSDYAGAGLGTLNVGKLLMGNSSDAYGVVKVELGP